MSRDNLQTSRGSEKVGMDFSMGKSRAMLHCISWHAPCPEAMLQCGDN